MANEKTMILEMVRDGKITVDEGVKLLNAIKQPTNSNNFDDFANDLKYKFQSIPKPDTEKIKENAQIFFDKTEEMFEEVGKTLKELFCPVYNCEQKPKEEQPQEEQNNKQEINTENTEKASEEDNK